MTSDKLPSQVLCNLRVMRHVVGRFPVPPHAPDVVIAGELVTALFAAVDVASEDPIAEGFGFRNSNLVDLVEIISQGVDADSVGQIIDAP